MKKFLFVCLGNVGRSQMAEAFYNNLTNSDNSWSAGVEAHTPEKYGHPAKKIVDIMNEIYIDVSHAVVKTVNQSMIDNSGIIIIMCEKNECPDFLLKSNKNVFWEDVKDPVGMSYEETRLVRDQIKQKIFSLIKSK